MAKKISRKKWRLACVGSNGNKTEIARRLDVDRQTVYNYIKQDDLFKRIYEDAKETAIDFVESQLWKHINLANEGMGDLNAIKFFLQTWGKDRGWSTRTEITGPDGDALFGVSLDSDVIEFLRKQGLTVEDAMSEAASQFNELVRMEMEKESAGSAD